MKGNMKAFIHSTRDGRDVLGTGFPHGGMVTKEYSSFSSLLKHALKGALPGVYHVEAFRDWGNRYGKADIDIMVNV